MLRPSPLLSICAAQRAGTYVIRIEGELDQCGCPDLQAALTEAEQTKSQRIVLDLDRLGSIDADGLEVLTTAARRSAANGNRLRLTQGSGDVAWLLRLTLNDRPPFAERV